MDALHTRKREDHPHRSLIPSIYIDTRKVMNDHHQKWSTYLEKFHLNIKYKKGNTNHVADYLNRPPVAELTTFLNSCGHETSR